MTTPWAAFLLAVCGGALLGRNMELEFRVVGIIAVGFGAILLAARGWQNRTLMAQVLAVIPVADKDDSLLRKLPKVWAALEEENLLLRSQAEAEDQIRRQILTHLTSGMLLLDQDQNLRVFNPSAQLLLGSSSSLGLGGPVVLAFREPESLRNIEQACQGVQAEWILKRNPRILRVRALPFEAPLQASSRPWVLVTVDDITRQEALETTRQKFIANASHELKTPVTGIRIAVENLQEGSLVLPDGESSLRIMLRAVDRMTMLLEDISELSRIETGALRLEPVPLRLGAFAEDALENTRPQSEAANVRVDLDLPAELEELAFHADPMRLLQLLDNLLSNAIKFSPAGAEVTVRVRRDGPWLVWAVEDHGPGISETDAQRIFERFYRAPSVRRIPGTGLGLAIVKHLAVLMNGEVDLNTEPGKGSTFIFRLPVTDVKQ
ncbi:MAG: HAMP domain-containing sensor histidine kinase [Holophaga sp.]|nr:HAMP domain-containing sensor histidine kinase [Holophaga sp.]